jgi:hypothetical protein
MLKLQTEAPYVHLTGYGAVLGASDTPSRNLPIGRIASPRNRARASIITRLLYDLSNGIAYPSNADARGALEELRSHVSQCILEACMKRELASQRDQESYLTKNFFDLAVFGRIMTNLTRNNAREIADPSFRFEEALKIVTKLLGNSVGQIHIVVDMPKLTLSTIEICTLMNVGLELVLNSVRHAFYKAGTGQVSVSLKERNNGQDLEFCVADNGCGPESLNFGCGLLLVSRVSAVVAGDITVRRQPSGGTGVALTFPKARS